MEYKEVIDYLYSSLPIFHRVGPPALKPGLFNTEKLCELLDNPQSKFKSIHVAGTNGKGSTSHLIASILQAAGYKTGLYTSPHLKSFTERIKINGSEIAEQDVVQFVQKYKNDIEKIQPSFFEVTVGMAFDFFARNKVDIAVIETGLGGRLDSTNVISPVLSVITNISFDHQNILGNTLEEIASEKAGIIKNNTPVVISETQNTIKNIFLSKAAKEKAPVHFADEIFSVRKFTLQKEGIAVEIFDNKKWVGFELMIGLQGEYQTKNIIGVLAAIEVLRNSGYEITDVALRLGIAEVVKRTGLKGRWQVLSETPYTVCDTGHNEDGIKQIVNQLQKRKFDNLYWVIGMVNDKDHFKVLNLLPKDAYYLFTQPKIPRAIKAVALAQMAKKEGLVGEVVEDVNEAFQKAKEIAKQGDFILVAGSTFVVAEIEGL